jgi:23S rRNA (pseudouridine1915-N3)-methyltransferase
VRVVIAVVGKPRDRALGAAIAEYETRAARYWRLEVREVREEPGRARTTRAVISAEGERLLAKLQPAGTTVACDARGRPMTSEAFATWLGTQRDQARDVTFVIGGAHGLSDAVLKGASLTLSLAPWTLPHELARLVLAEQLYRAGTILRGEPYHK